MKRFLKEGEHLYKIKALSLSLETLQGVRRVTLWYFYSMGALILLTASLVSILVYSVGYHQTRSGLPVDGVTISLSLAALFALGYLRFSMSEKRWIQSFQLDEKIRKVQRGSVQLRLLSTSDQVRTMEGEGNVPPSEIQQAAVVERRP